MAPGSDSSWLEIFAKIKAYFDPRLFEVHSTVDNVLPAQPKSISARPAVHPLEAVPIIPAKGPDNSLYGLHTQIRGDAALPLTTRQQTPVRSVSSNSRTRTQQKDFSPFWQFC